jgi:hypothetical protein
MDALYEDICVSGRGVSLDIYQSEFEKNTYF